MVVQISVAVIALAVVVLTVYIIRLLHEVTGVVQDVKRIKDQAEETLQEAKDHSDQVMTKTKSLLGKMEHKKWDVLFSCLALSLKLLKLKNYFRKEEEKNMSNGNQGKTDVVMAALVGGVVGAAGAMLLAPKSGEETRTNLRHYSDQAKDRLEDVVERMNEAVKLAGDNAAYKEKIKNWIDRIKELTPNKDDDSEVQKQLDDIYQQLEDIHKEVAASSSEERSEQH